MAKIIMAVGRSMGPYYHPNKPEKAEPDYYEIASGPQVGEFTKEQALVWGAAHDDFEAHAYQKFNRARLEKVAREQYGITNPAPAVDFLLSEGVLIEIDFEDDLPVDFFKLYRLVPTGTCVGNLPEKREYFRLVGPGEQTTVISDLAVGVWSDSHISGSMWDGCRRFSKAYKKQGKDYPPEAFATELAQYLPAIVATVTGVVEPLS